MARKMDAPVGSRGQGTTVAERPPEIAPGSPLERITELRLASAPLALKKSHELCRHPLGAAHSTGGRNCGWFHGAWQYMMLLGLAPSPERNLKFYLKEIRHLAAERGFRHILIAGCSDYMMLSIVLEAFRGLPVIPQITVIDRCTTPLYLCRWFAKRFACDLTTQQHDILTYQPERHFDIVCTDGLLTNVRPDVRAGVVAAWHRALKPGGFVVTTNNIQPGEWAKNTVNTKNTIAALCEKAAERNAAFPVKLGLTDEAVRDLTSEFFSHPRAQTVRSEEEFRAFFRPDQFRIDKLDIAEIDGNAIRDADNAGKVHKTLNARIVAARL